MFTDEQARKTTELSKPSVVPAKVRRDSNPNKSEYKSSGLRRNIGKLPRP
jgi:hypothetical protein